MNLLRPRTVYEWIASGALAVVLVCGVTTMWWLSRYARAVHRLGQGRGDTVFYGADGRPWFKLDEQRQDVPLAAIALDLQHAVVAIEDRRFYLHPGIDPIGIARAAFRDVRQGSLAEGGSTLTQQLARTLFLSNTRTYGRKVKEAALAILLEAEFTKPRILELYLNRMFLSAGVYGVEAMSERLFDKRAKDVSLAEAALIAGLLRAPSALSPWSNYEGALERSRVVLAAMREQGFITAAQEKAARRARPSVLPYRSSTDTRAAWVKDYLKQQFRNEFGGDHPADWQVHTSFQPDLQEAAERAVASGLTRLKHRGLEAALVAIDPATGDLLAMVGGGEYLRSTFNRATRSRRQPGSAFKPLVYAAALEQGYSPVSVLSNLLSVSAPGDPEWNPRNAGADEQPDALSLRAALLTSNNAAAAELQQEMGSRAVLRLAGNAGLSDLPDVPSLALGTGLVTPLELTTAFTMFPGGGEVAHPRSLVRVLDATGREVFAQRVDRRRVMSRQAAFQMVTMLRDVIDRGTGNGARSMGVDGTVGGKTGTTDDYRDAWFVGFSSSVVAGVWVGMDQPTSIGEGAYGAQVALPIWADFMRQAERVKPGAEFEVPDGLESVELCHESYLRPRASCPTYTEYFKAGDLVPSAECSVHTGSPALKAVQDFFRSLGGLFRRR